MAQDRFDHAGIEKRAQEKWARLGIYETDVHDQSKEPHYTLFEFPFPSGDLHIGHWYAFALTDVYARLKRMQGKNVLFPMGFDSFGLPAENAAMKKGIDVHAWIDQSIERMREQVRSMGTSVDWTKEVVTSDPAYYAWTQWLFTQLFEKGIAYRGTAVVNWDPVDNTVLANEQVLPDGTAERSGAMVEKRELQQWFMRITAYADRLIDDLAPLPWKEDIKDAQRAWIGRSQGAHVPFKLLHTSSEKEISVFTTRPDTLFGVTYLVFAPELPRVQEYLDAGVLQNAEEVRGYISRTKAKSERDRLQVKEKTGVRLEGVVALHPITGEELPVYIADYVIASYGTGAVMAVPAHDERDFEFAQLMGLPVKQVVAQPFKQTTEPGVYREGEPTVVKDGIIAIIRHWSEEKYLGLKWKQVAWGTFLTGGVDTGMTPEETIAKEILEETGYMHTRIVRKIAVVDGLFYHVPKGTNQHVHGHVFEVHLDDDARNAVDAEENAKHDLQWLTLDELGSFLTPDTHLYALAAFRDGFKPYSGDGSLVNSGAFTGRDNREAMDGIIDAARGTRTTNYRLRDWLVSRQRYWGCPIPIVYDPEGNPHAVPKEHLPWLLPTDAGSGSAAAGKSPLAASKELQDRTTRIFGEGWTPECDTLDVFVDSSWYYLRYLDPKNPQAIADPSLIKRWMPVKRYSGGSEHTTVHLLYSRFLYKALFDLGLVPSEEPFVERFNRGLIMGTDGQKMSKRWGNIINPDEQVAQYGADAVRMYLAFIGPYNEAGSYPWKHEGVEAMRRFLDRVYKLRLKVDPSNEPTLEQRTALAVATDKLGQDIDRFKLNTAVSAFMILVNALEKEASIARETFISMLTILAPLAPHLAEALYEEVGGEDATKGSIHAQPWPYADPSLLSSDTVTIGIQIAGKRRGEMTIPAAASQEEAVEEAKKLPAVRALFEGGASPRVVYVTGKIFNIVP